MHTIIHNVVSIQKRTRERLKIVALELVRLVIVQDLEPHHEHLILYLGWTCDRHLDLEVELAFGVFNR